MCCGHGRRQLQTRFSHQAASAPATGGMSSGSTFEYVGNSGLTVVGPATGARYRFERPGARMRVDLRDHVGLTKIPVLRHVG
jgi:hypothetical protein